MKKRILAVLVILVLILQFAFADDNLLRRSIDSCIVEELRAMSVAFGLDPDGDEVLLRQRLFDFFGITVEEDIEEVQEGNATSVRVNNADAMFSSGDMITLSGNVSIAFSTDGQGERYLTADRVAVDIPAKRIQASGNVIITSEDSSRRTFTGEVIALDWSNLDVVVFEGKSSTTRSNSGGTAILFYVSGEEVSYDGESEGIFFSDGTIATWETDPYWSITAKNLSLSGNDMFVDRAVFRLGRVPVFYFPVFFYPGTTLSFNPSIGFSSTRGAFLTTTYEVYGNYPGLGVTGTKTSNSASGSDDETATLSTFTSFLDTGTATTMVNDGIYYRELKEGEELSALEQWARTTGSYLAVFADVYQYTGPVIGYDTKNFLFDNDLTISSVGALGYRPAYKLVNIRKLRYTFDFTLDYNPGDLSLSVKFPLRSDPQVRVDFLNRNTAFNLDAITWAEQFFPSTYTSQSTYTWSADLKYRKTLGNFTFRLDSLKADVDYKLRIKNDAATGESFYEPLAQEASLPYVSFSSDGVFLNLRGEEKSTVTYTTYTNELARSFMEEQNGLQIPEGAQPVSDGILISYDGPQVNLQQTSVSAAPHIKAGYTYSQSLDNTYGVDLEHDSFYTKINGSLYVDAAAPGQWFSVTGTLKPQFGFSRTGIATQAVKDIEEFYLSSTVKATSSRLGLTYNLSQKIYMHYLSTGTEKDMDRWGEWDASDVTAHDASFSKTVGSFSFSLYVQLKPLTEIVKPAVSFSANGFSASADFSMKRPAKQEDFEKDVSNLNLSYRNDYFSVSLSNKYDFSKIRAQGSDVWDGYSVVQKASVSPVKNLTFSEDWSLAGRFVAKSLSFSGSYSMDTDVVDLKSSVSMGFKGEEYDRDVLKLSLGLSQDEVHFYKRRIGLQTSVNFSFQYDFENPYKSSFITSLSLNFAIAEFLDLAFSISSENKAFARYFENGEFSISKMWEDLKKSFDFFGTGRRNTGFNLSGFKIQLVHYMRDWNLYIDAQGILTTQYTGKYEWVPNVTVYIKWNAIPELKTQGSWDSYNKEWT